ncbi:MAG: response regulator transcription factor [Chitinispirillia bacterium]|nr:response regulator transcription factor [Chitinispirillia bacterium]MCL2268968.1 response regulator transcription factor [Chitinispirillia bacterium]
MPLILLIDDQEGILTANSEYLVEMGMEVECADTGLKALDRLRSKRYDCVVLDVLLPDIDGFSICKAARTITDAPILFLSCMEETDDKVRGLMAGGDDYMCKPYSLKEFGARVQALMRRSGIVGSESTHANYHVDTEKRIIYALGKGAVLSEREFVLFELLRAHPEKPFSTEELLEKIWQGNAEANVVSTLVSRLRRKIEFAEDSVGRIASAYGEGYCLLPPKH